MLLVHFYLSSPFYWFTRCQHSRFDNVDKRSAERLLIIIHVHILSILSSIHILIHSSFLLRYFFYCLVTCNMYLVNICADGPDHLIGFTAVFLPQFHHHPFYGY